MRRTRARRGFTFAETLAAMVFMAVVTPTIVGAMYVCANAASLSRHKRVAARLADLKLTELTLDDSWRDADDDGDFGEDWPGYRWTFEDGAWDEDTMCELTVTVWFQARGREHSVSLGALVSETDTSEPEDTTNETATE